MKAAPFSLSLRARLLLAITLVQVLMLTMLIIDGVSVMREKLVERTEIHVRELKQLLNAALAVPLAAGDRVTAAEVIERVQRDSEIAYLVLFDASDQLVSASGWDMRDPLPLPLPLPRTALRAKDLVGVARIDSVFDIASGGARYGKLQFGLTTEFLQTAQSDLVRDSL
ncbi:MAG: hypothetical protein OEZ08_13890, partial [Betaproteobacteria bacterium]|nr:hypothetical protein [Betaproteobacteria bacterium]